MITAFSKIIDDDHTPDVEPWTQCHAPYDCEFLDRCTANKPKDWIFYLPHLGLKRGELLRAKGIESLIRGIPEDVDLTAHQAIICEVYRTGMPHISPGLESALRHFGPPACYLDLKQLRRRSRCIRGPDLTRGCPSNGRFIPVIKMAIFGIAGSWPMAAMILVRHSPNPCLSTGVLHRTNYCLQRVRASNVKPTCKCPETAQQDH